MTPEERKAMQSINRHFTFREMTAFLVGYRLARRSSERIPVDPENPSDNPLLRTPTKGQVETSWWTG